MKVQEYRDLTTQMFRVIDDWSACVDEKERQAWFVRASLFHAEFANAVCARATDHDLELHSLAVQKYSLIVASVRQIAPSVPRAPASRAAKYNRSPGRAVRLARSARSAMRRGYF